jgi:hypothetical protein
MSTVINICKKYKTEIAVICVLLLIPIIEPIFEVLVEILFTTGNVVGTWVRKVSEIGYFCS